MSLVGHYTCIMIKVHACIMILAHVSCTRVYVRRNSGWRVRGAKSFGNAGGFGGHQAPQFFRVLSTFQPPASPPPPPYKQLALLRFSVYLRVCKCKSFDRVSPSRPIIIRISPRRIQYLSCSLAGWTWKGDESHISDHQLDFMVNFQSTRRSSTYRESAD